MMVAWWSLLGVVAVERCVEMVLSRRHAIWSFAQGGIEYGSAHYPYMVLLHTAFLVGCAVEPLVFDRPFLPPLGWTCLAIAAGCQALRWWCIRTLGKRWNTRVIVVPGLSAVTTGPYQYFRHPNYLAVIGEGLALPLIHSAWLTAIAFTLLNTVLLWVRIGVEDAALGRDAKGVRR